MVVSDAPPAAPSFLSQEKRWGRKECLGDAGCILPLHSGRKLSFHLAFHSVVTLRAFWYASPDTGVPNLQLVSVEYLPSIEGAVEIQMDVASLRGKAPLSGELSAEQTERLLQLCIEKTQTASFACGGSFRRGRF